MNRSLLGIATALFAIALVSSGCSKKQESAAPAARLSPQGGGAGTDSQAGGAGVMMGGGGTTDSKLVGQEAPDFALDSHTGERFALADARGKQHVLLYFYKGDW